MDDIGQYHYVVNLTKREFLHPHKLGDGLKLMEFGNSGFGGTMTALAVLLAVSNGRGGGDIHSDDPYVGRWGGDRIAIVGDYAEKTDLPKGMEDADKIYNLCGLTEQDREYMVEEAIEEREDEDLAEFWRTAEPFTDISAHMRTLLQDAGEATYEGETGWIKRGAPGTTSLRPDFIVGG